MKIHSKIIFPFNETIKYKIERKIQQKKQKSKGKCDVVMWSVISTINWHKRNLNECNCGKVCKVGSLHNIEYF